MKKPYACLKLSVSNHVASVVLDRPPVNALNRQLVAELTTVARQLKKRREVWLVTVTSACPAFCAGADLKERAALPQSKVAAVVQDIQSMVVEWLALPQPVIMGITGAALGGGLEFALSGDILVASENALFGFPEVGLGIIPAAGGTQLLSLRTSPGIAKRWILSGQRFPAHRALADGVVHEVFPENTFREEFSHLVGTVASNAPLALRQAKNAINETSTTHLKRGFRKEQTSYKNLIHTIDRFEALKAFLEKRPPHWKGK